MKDTTNIFMTNLTTIVKKALCIGIEDYGNSTLYGCKNDTIELSKILKRNYDNSKNFDTRCETNLDTISELHNCVRDLFSGDGEIALFYFSGHGVIQDGRGYLVTPDCQEGSPGLDIDSVINLANQSKFKNKIIILDTCYSGSAGCNSLHPKYSILTDGLTIMTACTYEQKAVIKDGFGIFTKLLIDGLSGGASDLLGNITAGGLYAYIDRCLGPWEQRPVFKTNVSSFSPIIRCKAPIELSVLKEITKIFSKCNEPYQLDPSYEFTNKPEYENECIEPYADDNNVKIMKTLQKLESVGLVAPVDEEHMYFAAMKSKKCKLTEIGKYYYNLIKEERI